MAELVQKVSVQLDLAEFLLCYHFNGCFVTLNWEKMRLKWKPSSSPRACKTNLSQGGWMATGSQGSLCFAGYQSKMSWTRTSRAAPSHQHSSLLLQPLLEIKLKSCLVRLGLKNFFQGEQAHVFDYTNLTLRTFTALVEKSFITSCVLDSVGLGAVPVFVTGVNKLCCTLLNHTTSMAFAFLKLPVFSSILQISR